MTLFTNRFGIRSGLYTSSSTSYQIYHIYTPDEEHIDVLMNFLVDFHETNDKTVTIFHRPNIITPFPRLKNQDEGRIFLDRIIEHTKITTIHKRHLHIQTHHENKLATHSKQNIRH